ncbi:MAG: tetratricopeptide repeat protein [Bacteroidia bacterium]
MKSSYDYKNEQPNYTNLDQFIKIGLSLLECGDFKEATCYFNKSLELNKTVYCYLILASCYFDEGFPEKAIELCMTALQHNPTSGLIHNDLGIYYFEIGMNDEAFEEFDVALETIENDKKYIVCYNLGRLFEVKGDWFEAKNFFDESLQHNPSYIEAIQSRTKILALLN